MMHWRLLGLCLSLLAPSASGTAATPSLHGLSDARLKQLVEDFAGEDGTKSEATLRRAGLDRTLPRLERLQRKTPKNQDLYFDLAFTLAYFGADYQRNVQRLTALDELWNRGDRRWYEYVSNQSDMRDEIPELMESLYRHNHDPALLRTLFRWRLDGGGAEVLSDVQFSLVRRYPQSVLQTIRRNSKTRQHAIGSIIFSANPGQYRNTVVRLRSTAQRAGPALERFTLRSIRQMDLYAAIQNTQYQTSSRVVHLRRADLSGLDLGGMDLTHLDLRGAALRHVNLSDSDLSGARLRGADLRGARYNRRTRWPKGFDPRRHGAVWVQ